MHFFALGIGKYKENNQKMHKNQAENFFKTVEFTAKAFALFFPFPHRAAKGGVYAYSQFPGIPCRQPDTTTV